MISKLRPLLLEPFGTWALWEQNDLLPPLFFKLPLSFMTLSTRSQTTYWQRDTSYDWQTRLAGQSLGNSWNCNPERALFAAKLVTLHSLRGKLFGLFWGNPDPKKRCLIVACFKAATLELPVIFRSLMMLTWDELVTPPSYCLGSNCGGLAGVPAVMDHPSASGRPPFDVRAKIHGALQTRAINASAPPTSPAVERPFNSPAAPKSSPNSEAAPEPEGALPASPVSSAEAKPEQAAASPDQGRGRARGRGSSRARGRGRGRKQSEKSHFEGPKAKKTKEEKPKEEKPEEPSPEDAELPVYGPEVAPKPKAAPKRRFRAKKSSSRTASQEAKKATQSKDAGQAGQSAKAGGRVSKKPATAGLGKKPATALPDERVTSNGWKARAGQTGLGETDPLAGSQPTKLATYSTNKSSSMLSGFWTWPCTLQVITKKRSSGGIWYEFLNPDDGAKYYTRKKAVELGFQE